MATATVARHAAPSTLAADVRLAQRVTFVAALIAVFVYGLVTGLQYSGAVSFYGGWHNGGIVLNSTDCGKAIGLEVWGHPGWFAPDCVY